MRADMSLHSRSPLTLLFRNMFSSEKVLQMSYANYQCVYPPISTFALLIFHSEARRLWSRSSRTHASWTRGKPGAQRSSTPLDPTKVSLSRSLLRPISVAKNAAATTVGRYTCLAFIQGTISTRRSPMVMSITTRATVEDGRSGRRTPARMLEEASTLYLCYFL